jgi:putative colanic acid biosynthesis acetyltransferase WcaF
MDVDLNKFKTGDYYPGPRWKVILWYITSLLFFSNAIPWSYKLKRRLLILFGCKAGKGLVIKPRVRIKYPWMLTVGKNCWIGESAWIDNMQAVTIGDNVCLSQGALILTGNHDYSSVDFAFKLGPITIENGVWICASAVVCPGVTCKTHSVLTVSSVATKTMDEWGIYSGNPAIYQRKRQILR